MADDIDAILGDEAEVEDVAAAEEAEPIEATTDESHEQKEEEQKAEQAPEPEVEAKPKDETPMVPLSALLAERDKARQATTQQPKEPVKAPDPVLEPEKFSSYLQSQISQAATSQALNTSELITRQQVGDDKVNEALEAAKAAGPQVVQGFINEPNPFGSLVKWHEQQKVAAEIGDPVAYKANLEAEIRQKILAEIAAEKVTETLAQPSPSLAGATNLGARNGPAWEGPTPLEDILS